MSEGSLTVPAKRRKEDAESQSGSCSSTPERSQEKWSKDLDLLLKSPKKEKKLETKVMEEVLFDIQEASKHVDDLREATSTTDTDINKLKESAVTKADCFAEKLDKVVSYLKLAIDDQLGVALHKAQFGDTSFPLENLPEEVLDIIFNYLECKDLKNIRLVSKRLSRTVFELRREMRSFEVNLAYRTDKHTLHLNNFFAKGFQHLKHFKLTLKEVSSKDTESVELCRMWKEHIVAIGVTLYKECPIPFKLEKLERLTLCEDQYKYEDIDATAVRDMINVHCASLKELTVGPYMYLWESNQTCNALPNLQVLTINERANNSILKSLFHDMARNITVLCLGEKMSDNGAKCATYKLPSLKQLRVEGSCALAILKANAAHLEMLSVTAYEDETFHFEGQSWRVQRNELPKSLPKLELLAIEYCNDKKHPKLLGQLIVPAAKSLKHLVLSCCSKSRDDKAINDNDHPDTLEMKNLTSLVYDHLSELTDSIIHDNSNTLEFIAVGMQQNGYRDLEAPLMLEKLKEVVLTYDEVDARSNYVYDTEMRAFYPHVSIRKETVDTHTSYCNDFMKRHGAHDVMKFSG